MSTRVADFCNRVQRHYMHGNGQMCLPDLRMYRTLAFLLYRHGYVGSVVRGTVSGPDTEYVPTTTANELERRLWVDLKYHQQRPVVTGCKVIGRPSKRIVFPHNGLWRLAAGKRTGSVDEPQPGETIFVAVWAEPYKKNGDLDALNRSMNAVGKNYEILELHEAVAKGYGGELLFRIK